MLLKKVITKVRFNFKGTTNLELPLIIGQLTCSTKTLLERIKILKKLLWKYLLEAAHIK